MSPAIARHCDNCKQYAKVDVKEGGILSCPNCSHRWGEVKSREDVFEHCPVCTCRQFYLAKDFNQAVGCLIMLVGIILVPFTYGLSLPVFALIDWLVYKRVATIINCYKCGSEFHGFKTQKKLKPFLHHIGLKYDKYR